MRVIAGTARGTRLLSVKGQKTRPVLDSVKESLFNIIREFVPDSFVVDIFAGTGSFGIEALSRGAAYCIFVDNATDAVDVIKQNLEKAGLSDRASVLKLNFSKLSTYLTDNQVEVDVLLVGPPYDLVEEEKGLGQILTLLQEIVEVGVLKPDGIIVLQHRKYSSERLVSELPKYPNLEIFDQRRYGITQLTFLQRSQAL